jgi:hypothetical protein
MQTMSPCNQSICVLDDIAKTQLARDAWVYHRLRPEARTAKISLNVGIWYIMLEFNPNGRQNA